MPRAYPTALNSLRQLADTLCHVMGDYNLQRNGNRIHRLWWERLLGLQQKTEVQCNHITAAAVIFEPGLVVNGEGRRPACGVPGPKDIDDAVYLQLCNRALALDFCLFG